MVSIALNAMKFICNKHNIVKGLLVKIGEKIISQPRFTEDERKKNAARLFLQQPTNCFTMYYEPFLPYLRYFMLLLNRYIIFCVLLLFGVSLQAQQPDETYFNIPVLKPGEKPEERLKADIFLRVIASKTTVFAGEPFLVEYKLYRSINSEPSPGKEPSFNGCSVIQLSAINEPYNEVFNGKKYNTVVTRKVQLTPLQEGPLILTEASVNNIVQVSIANNPVQMENVSFTVVSQPLTINVIPLPEKDKPVDFTGLVGNFTISAKLDSNTIPAGDNTHFTLVIKGAGNIGNINLPPINWPANIEHFEALDTQHTSQDNFPTGGDKVFNIPFLGKKQGDAVIPSVSFSYFDPLTQKYVTAHSDSLRIHFSGPLPKEQQKEIVTEDITNRKYLWIVPALALTVTFILIISGKSQRREKKRQLAKKVEEYEKIVHPEPAPVVVQAIDFKFALRALSEIENDHVFFNKATELLTAALHKKLDTGTLHQAELLGLLKLNAEPALFENASALYQVCNQSLYSPILDSEQRLAVQQSLAELFDQLGV